VVDVLTDSLNPRDYWFKMKIIASDEKKLGRSIVSKKNFLKESENQRLLK